MSQKHKVLYRLLIELEDEMQQTGHWKGTPPSASAFESSEPFAVDTMTFDEWLQFVFIARLHAIIEAKGVLPIGSQVFPMAEEVWRGDRSLRAALKLIDQIDLVLGRPAS